MSNTTNDDVAVDQLSDAVAQLGVQSEFDTKGAGVGHAPDGGAPDTTPADVGADQPAVAQEDVDFVKLFVGQIPKSITEQELRSMFEGFGNIVEVVKIPNRKDPNGTSQLGCAFVKYSELSAAKAAIEALSNSKIIPPLTAPMQVRFADGENERLGSSEHKLFAGNLPVDVTEEELREKFTAFGEVLDVFPLREDPTRRHGRCAFVKMGTRAEALAAIEALDGKQTLRSGGSGPNNQKMAVRFAQRKNANRRRQQNLPNGQAYFHGNRNHQNQPHGGNRNYQQHWQAGMAMYGRPPMPHQQGGMMYGSMPAFYDPNAAAAMMSQGYNMYSVGSMMQQQQQAQQGQPQHAGQGFEAANPYMQQQAMWMAQQVAAQRQQVPQQQQAFVPRASQQSAGGFPAASQVPNDSQERQA